jgi:ribosomal protein S18 acetylase RimI-like enzyme
VTVTAPAEALAAAAAGADVLVVQGAEAGGHRASFVDRDDVPVYGLISLLQLVAGKGATPPLVASGGLASGAGIAAALAAGARAAQVGSAFMLAAEAGTSPVHRRALASPAPTALTRSFTGRLARGIRNGFMDTYPDAPIAYPELHYATAPLRRAARLSGDGDSVNLWAGETHQLASELPARAIVERLQRESEAALARLAAASAEDDRSRPSGMAGFAAGTERARAALVGSPERHTSGRAGGERIRPATPAELPAVLALWREADALVTVTDTVGSLERLLEFDPEALLVAGQAGAPSGSLIVAWNGWRGSFFRLAVRPDRRRTGLATALVREGEARLVRRGARRIDAIVTSADTGALSYWAAVGYTQQEDRRRYVRNIAADVGSARDEPVA